MIISGFAGIGKSTMAKNHPDKVIDLESSNFKWAFDESVKDMDVEERKGVSNKTLHPDWPNNYIQAIKENSQKYDFVFISMDMDVRNILDSENIRYFVAYPSLDCKDDYIARYRARNNNEAFVKLLESNFDNWVSALMNSSGSQIRLHKGEYISDKFSL